MNTILHCYIFVWAPLNPPYKMCIKISNYPIKTSLDKQKQTSRDSTANSPNPLFQAPKEAAIQALTSRAHDDFLQEIAFEHQVLELNPWDHATHLGLLLEPQDLTINIYGIGRMDYVNRVAWLVCLSSAFLAYLNVLVGLGWWVMSGSILWALQSPFT